jgi:hypothetical protein
MQEKVEASKVKEEVKVDKITESPIFVYKQSIPGTPIDGKFCAIHAADISSIDQGWHHNDNLGTKDEYCCVTMKHVGNTESMGHFHLQVGFQELMLRWLAWAEGR